MFLHLGSDVMVFVKDIIAILDFETTTLSKITREFLAISEEEEFIINVSQEDLPKSFIITEVDRKSKIYISPISSVTLNKRFDELYSENVLYISDDLLK